MFEDGSGDEPAGFASFGTNQISSGPDEYFQAGRGPGAQYLPYLEHQEENASSTQGSERSNASGTVITGARRVRQRVVPHRVHFVTLSHLFSFSTNNAERDCEQLIEADGGEPEH